MMRILSSLTTLLAVTLTCVSAVGAPPQIRPLDVVTIHAISETSRGFERAVRELPPDRAQLRTKIIVLDPGHGGANDGAIGVAARKEKELTLDLAYALRDAIEARYPDATVLLTRYWDRDVDLELRTQWANARGADLFLSLHYNAASHDRALGYETFHLSEETMATTADAGSRRKQPASKAQKRAFRRVDEARVTAHTQARAELRPAHHQSKVFAKFVQTELAQRLTSIDRGVREANFAVLRGAKMPAVVVESGFLTHPVEGREVLTVMHRNAVVAALLAAIEAYNADLSAVATQASLDTPQPN